MFLQFKLKNMLSYQQEMVFSMLPTTDKELKGNIIPSNITNDKPLLKSAVLYGANASGKSNLLKAIYYLRWIILNGHRIQTGDPLPVFPFKLFTKNLIEPTWMEIVFIKNNIRYIYGITLTKQKIYEEYLYYYPKKQKSIIFERNNTSEYKFIQKKDEQKQLAKKTLENTPYLSSATKWNFQLTKDPFNWFLENVRIGLDYKKPDWLYYTASIINEKKDLILSFLRKADFSITDIQVKKKELKENDNSTPSLARIINQLKEPWEITTFHKAKDEKGNLLSAPFAMEEESSGTQKYLEIVGQWLEVVQNNKILFFDEFDSSLHPVLAEYLIHNFHINTGYSQLIFATHNTNLLSSHLFRRDQFWITEMHPQQGYTDLYSLAELKIRKDHNLEKGYIAGKYGGIPFPG